MARWLESGQVRGSIEKDRHENSACLTELHRDGSLFFPWGRRHTLQDDGIPRGLGPVAFLEWREIGPAVVGGRVSDLAVDQTDTRIIYVGTATSGIWKSTNHGTTWEPIFTNQSTASVGDVTLAPSDPNVVWVGTGEPQNRQSSPWGDGVFKSMDGGRTWVHKGLRATRHISRIQVDPRNPDVAYVAAVGNLWTESQERGVYKTADGGDSWERVLYLDTNTGAIDLAMDPSDPNTLFAAMYSRRRTAWGFNGGGPGSGIYRTVDGGANWTRLIEGLPDGDLGRIGLDIYRRDGNLRLRYRGGPPWPNGGLRLHGPRRHLGKTLQYKPTTDVLQPDPGRPQRPRAHLRRRPESHALRRRGEELYGRRGRKRPSRPPRALDRSERLQPPAAR